MQPRTTAQSAGPSLMPMVTGAWASQAICTAATLGLADLLAQGHQSAEALAHATGTQPAALARLLRALAALGVFCETEQGLFASTPLGDQLRSDAPGSLRNLAMMVGGPEARRAWSDLTYSLRTGNSAFRNVFGMDTYEYRTSHPSDRAVFNAAMADMTRQVAAAAIAAYDFGRFGSIVDVGGGNGALLASLLITCPGLSGIVFDLPSGTEGAAETISEAGIGDRCQIVHGDFFTAVPAGADAYLLKSVMHNWDDEKCGTILSICSKAMVETARLLVIEQVLPARVEADPLHRRALLTDLNMLVMTGGRERSEAQYAELLRTSGLEISAITATASSFSIVEARRTHQAQ